MDAGHASDQHKAVTQIVLLESGDLNPGDLPQGISITAASALFVSEDDRPAQAGDLHILNYRQAVPELDLEKLENDFAGWFKSLLVFIDSYAAQDERVLFRKVNLLSAASATAYLRLYRLYEDFICASLLLSRVGPERIIRVKDKAAPTGSGFSRSLAYLAKQRGIAIDLIETSGSKKVKNTPLFVRRLNSLLSDIGLLSNALRDRLRRTESQDTIYCVEENVYNIEIFRPIIAEADHRQSGLDFSILSLRHKIAAAVRKTSLPGISPYAGIDTQAPLQYLRALRQLRQGIEQLLSSQQFQGLFRWAGVDAWSLARGEVRLAFIKENIKILWYLVLIEKLFNHTKPRSVMTTYGLTHYRRAIIELAKNLGIPTFILQNAAVPHQRLWSLLPDHPMLVWGEAVKEFLVSQGARPENIQVVGPLKYPPAADQGDIDRAGEIKKLGLLPEHPLILFTANFTGAWGTYYDWELAEMLRRIVEQNPDYQVVITLHPRCPADLIAAVERLGGPQIKVLRSADMGLLYRIADLGVTMFSTTAIDASLAGLPFINVLTHRRPDWLGMGRLGAALIARDEQELASSIGRILSDPHLRQHIRDGQKRYQAAYLNCLDMGAGEKIVKMLLEHQSTPA